MSDQFKTTLNILLATLVAATLTACSDSEPAATIEPTLSSIQQNIFTPTCSGCHGNTTASEGLNLADGVAYANLVNVSSNVATGEVLVLPNLPDASYLTKKLIGANDIVGGQMPGNGVTLSSAEFNAIIDWIEAGALDN